MSNPCFVVRLEPKAFEELVKRAGGLAGPGRAGGVSLYVRRLIYEHLGWEMPVQFGDLGRSSRLRKPTGRPCGRPKKERHQDGD